MKRSLQFRVYSLQTLITAYCLLSTVYCLLFAVLPAVPAHAVDVLSPVCQQYIHNGKVDTSDPNVPSVCKDAQAANQGDPILGSDGILATVVNLLSLVGGVVAVIAIIIGGIKMIVSGGDSNSVASARRTVLYAIVSVLIIAMAQLIVRFIVSRL